jgi:uncharacterized protein YidB (DUF937 family)
MSLIEDVLTKAVTKALGDDKGDLAKVLMPILVSLLAGGGLSKILDKMKEMGLGEQADSWVGGGPNKEISAADAKKVVGEAKVSEIAGKVGLSEDQAAALIAKALPEAVDQASPKGKKPEPAEVDDEVGKWEQGIDQKA